MLEPCIERPPSLEAYNFAPVAAGPLTSAPAPDHIFDTTFFPGRGDHAPLSRAAVACPSPHLNDTLADELVRGVTDTVEHIVAGEYVSGLKAALGTAGVMAGSALGGLAAASFFGPAGAYVGYAIGGGIAAAAMRKLLA